MKKEELPIHWASVLQALAFWIAYKQQYFRGHLLPEGAIVAELTQLISANIDSDTTLACEIMYESFEGVTADKRRIDIVIGSKSNEIDPDNIFSPQGPFEFMEVKRYENDIKLIYKDAEKLFALKQKVKNARCFQLIVGQKEPPVEFITENHNAKRQNIYEGQLSIQAHPRLLKKAYGTKHGSGLGTFAALIEIL